MRIAYNPKTAAALTAAPSNDDITFDLKGISIYVKGVKFKGTDTTYSVFKKHTSDNKGGYNGLVPVPSYTTTTTRYLREDGTWVVPTNTTYSVFTGATSSTDGTLGLVPKPTLGNQGKFLKADGTWAIPTNTTYGVVSSSTNGLAPKVINTNTATVGSSYYVLASTNGSTSPSWYKLPANAFKNDNTTYTFVSGNGGFTVTPSGGTAQVVSIGKVDWANITNKPDTFTPSAHTHATDNITKLTSYTKATSASDLATTDTLNTALGKLEYKADYAYDWIIGVTASDTDEYINKWSEIVGFLDSVKEGTDILDEFVTRKTDLTITGLKTFESNSSTTGISLILKNKGWAGNMSTAIDFYNGNLYTVPNARIETKMLNDGRNGGTLIFYTQEKHAETNPNPNNLTERFRIGDNGVSKITGLLAVTGNITTSGSFCGNLNKTLTFTAGGFSAATSYNNSAATTVNIPTHTSHLTNNSGFLTQHQSLENYVTLNTALTITGAKTFDNTVLVRREHTDEKNPDKKNHYGVRLLGSDKIGYLLLGQFTGDEKIHNGSITGINNTNLTSLEIKSLNTEFSGNIATNTLVISNKNNAKHILFSRGSETDHPYNYIAAPTGGIISILPNGVTNSSTSGMLLSSNGFHPATAQTYALGTSNLRWSSIYSNIGNFSGNVTSTGFVKSGSSDSYVLLGGGGHKALSDFMLKSDELTNNLTTITKTLTVTASWMDTGIEGGNIAANGTYVVQVYAHNSADSLYYCYWSGIMTWYKDGTNDSDSDEIILHRSGHAYGNTIYLRTIMNSNGKLKLQIAANKALANAIDYTFKFKRVI